MIVFFKKVTKSAIAPVRAHPDDAGWDLFYDSCEPEKSGVFNFHTGIAVQIPTGYFGLLRPRSSIRNTVFGMASSGIIDSGYRGEIIIPLRVVGHGGAYQPGDKICQLVVLPLPDVKFIETDKLDQTDRGTGGFGSTGK